MAPCYIIICRDDDTPDGSKGEYILAMRRQFTTRDEADIYASLCSPSREPLVVECPHGLHYPEPLRPAANQCEYCPHLPHSGQCPHCAPGEFCNPHPQGSTLPGYKKTTVF